MNSISSSAPWSNALVGTLQWTSSTKDMLVDSVTCICFGTGATAWGASGRAGLLLSHATGFTVAPTTNGTSYASSISKLATANAASAVTDVQFTTSGTALTGHTISAFKTIGAVEGYIPVTADTVHWRNVRMDSFSAGEVKVGLRITQNEGLAFHGYTPSATGTAVVLVLINWREVTL